MNPQEMTLEQLKAAVYDRVREIERCQAEIRELNQLIGQREIQNIDPAKTEITKSP